MVGVRLSRSVARQSIAARKTALPAAAAVLLFLLIQTVAAEEPELGEVIVNGERLARSRLETASSLSVVSRAELAHPGADRIDQLLALTPNVQLGSGGEGPAIRGQDSTGALRDLPGFLGGARPRGGSGAGTNTGPSVSLQPSVGGGHLGIWTMALLGCLVVVRSVARSVREPQPAGREFRRSEHRLPRS